MKKTKEYNCESDGRTSSAQFNQDNGVVKEPADRLEEKNVPLKDGIRLLDLENKFTDPISLSKFVETSNLSEVVEQIHRAYRKLSSKSEFLEERVLNELKTAVEGRQTKVPADSFSELAMAIQNVQSLNAALMKKYSARVERIRKYGAVLDLLDPKN